MYNFVKHITLVVTLITTLSAFTQEANNLWKGNKSYKERNYDEAQIAYQKSMDLEPSEDAAFNMANALYKQQKYEDAAKLYEGLVNSVKDKKERAQAYHNLGNSYLKTKQLDKGISAYKNALRNNPTDEDSRYNLSYALKMKQEEEEQEDQNEDKEDQQDQQDDQQDKEDQEKNQNEQDQQDQQDQENQKDQQDKQKEQQQEQPQNKNEISKEDAERLLENLENDEEKTQEKVKMQQRKGSKVKIENDW